MQMLYAFRDPRVVEIQRASKHFSNVQRRMREILQEWYDHIVEKGNCSSVFSGDSRLVM
jgi:hypothetical protein